MFRYGDILARNSKMNNKKKIVVAVLSVLFLMVIAWKIAGMNSSTDTRQQPSTIVQVERPHREKVLYRLNFNADAVPIQQANIFSKINGNLERIFVDIGTRVERNQLLALIDTMELSQLARQAEATHENAKLNFNRMKELAGQNLIAKQELDNAEATMRVAKANYEAATTRLNYAHITAPFSGYITKKVLDQGVNVKANDIAIFTLMDIDVMKIMVNVLEKDIPLISKGKKGIVTVDAYPGKEFYGSVTRISQAVDLSTRTMAVQIDIANPDHVLKPGMFASVTVIVDEHPEALTIPVQALVKDEKGKYLYTVNGSTAHRREVSLGVEHASRIEIVSGLSESDSVIVTGQQFAKDGAQVIIQQ